MFSYGAFLSRIVVVLPLVPFLLAVAFFWAAVAKASRPSAWRAALAGYRVPARFAGAVLVGVPVIEIVAGVLLCTAGDGTRAGAALVVALLGAFSLAVLRARSAEGDRLPCGCFGGSGRRDYRLMLVRNALLGFVAATVLVSDRVAAYELDALPSSQAVPAFLVVAGVALAVWLVTAAARGFSR